MVKTIAVVAAITALAAGCGSDDEQTASTPEAAVTSSGTITPPTEPAESATEDPTTEQPATEGFTAAEQAYIDAEAELVGSDDPFTTLELGQDYCAALTGYRGDHLVAYLIEESEVQWDEPAIRYLCPRVAPALAAAKRGFGDGAYTVARKITDTLRQIRPGTYETMPGAHDCYWSRLTKGGSIIRNAFVDFASGPIRVTIRSTDGGFKSDGCTAWLRRK